MKLNPLAASRRKFLAAAPAVAAVPLLSACGGDDVTSAPVTDAALAAQMSAKLNAQLGDAATVGAIQPALTDVGFTWDLPSMPAAQAGAIVAYSFGNRPNAASGNTSSTGGNQSALPDPGPVNEALADAVYRIRQLKPVKVYAQWRLRAFSCRNTGWAPTCCRRSSP